MDVGKGYGSGITFLDFWFRLYIFYRYDLKFGKIPKNEKNPKIAIFANFSYEIKCSLILVSFIRNVLIKTCLLVPKLRLSGIAFEFYEAK